MHWSADPSPALLSVPDSAGKTSSHPLRTRGTHSPPQGVTDKNSNMAMNKQPTMGHD